MKHTQESLLLTRTISDAINNQTMHHHYHILYDIANTYPKDTNITYVEIGCYAGGSSCLMLQRPNTRVISIDLGQPISKETVYSNVKNLNKFNNQYERMNDFDYKMQQFLGYHSRVPSSLDEWYQPEEYRFYKKDQDSPI
jgi:hypothetical protein